MCYDQVKKSLLMAFPWITDNEQELLHKHNKWREMRQHLPLLSNELLLHYLPYVLYDLLVNHTNDPIQTDGAEFVVMELNVLRSHSFTYYSELSSAFGQPSAEQSFKEDVIQAQKEASKFQRFNKEQSSAISAWLSLAKTWNDFHIFKDDIENAFLYWHERSNAYDKVEA